MLFCEDAAHEGWARALLSRLAREEGIDVSITIGSARFGIPRLKQELKGFDRALRRGSGLPDLLIILIDANDAGVSERRREIDGAIDLTDYPHAVVGVPDPHVECWYVADPPSFGERFGAAPSEGTVADCKERLVTALEEADEIVVSGGAEFADEIVDVMDLYRAGRGQAELKAFIDGVRGALKRLKNPV